MGSIPEAKRVDFASNLIHQLESLNKSAFDQILDHDDYRKQALHIAQQLTLSLEKPQTVPLNSILPVRSTVARIAVDLDLFNLLADGSGSKTVEELASKTNSDPVLMARILRILDCMGWAKQVEVDSFAPTEIGEVVRTRKPIEAGIKHLFDIALPVFSDMPEYFRRHGYISPQDEAKGPFQYAFHTDETAFNWWAGDPVKSTNFNTFMTGTGGGKKNHWTKWFPVEGHLIGSKPPGKEEVLLVDVGGGRGHDLDAFITKFPAAGGRYILEDLPSVIDDYQEVNSAIEPVKHSFFDPQPIHGARAYFLHHVLHNWSDDSVIKILTAIRGAMKPVYSRILINESVLPDRDCPAWKAEMDWWMMAIHAGSQRTESHFRTLCEKSGLVFCRYWAPPGGGDGIIEAMLGPEESAE
ncbi:putative O-methyltransferase domain-containing protein [Seiridium cardinale]|uniref:O-methyltransferase domain-containing protein n=1 Tax=Seiridium cardinale TaxID=138064 RepID=A0ABR2XGQ0_9PEZI